VKLAASLLFAAIACSCLLGQRGNQAPSTPESISGMYSFLREGEFVQVTVEDAGHVTGFVSRYGDSEGDRGVFLNQFFKTGKLDGAELTFTTETVHLVWFELQARVEKNPKKQPGDEGYCVLRGKLTEYRTDANGKPSSKSYEVALKSFPRDMGTPPSKE
jgi:hypothetical protein